MNQKPRLLAVPGFLILGLVLVSAAPPSLAADAEPWTLGVAVQTAGQGEILPCT